MFSFGIKFSKFKFYNKNGCFDSTRLYWQDGVSESKVPLKLDDDLLHFVPWNFVYFQLRIHPNSDVNSPSSFIFTQKKWNIFFIVATSPLSRFKLNVKCVSNSNCDLLLLFWWRTDIIPNILHYYFYCYDIMINDEWWASTGHSFYFCFDSFECTDIIWNNILENMLWKRFNFNVNKLFCFPFSLHIDVV